MSTSTNYNDTIDQRWNRSGFFMTGTGSGPKTSDRIGQAGLPATDQSTGNQPVDRSQGVHR